LEFINLFLDNENRGIENGPMELVKLDEVTQATFAPLVGTRFVAPASAASVVELELIQAQALPIHAGRDKQKPQRAPFALVFRGPREFVLPQRIYRLEQAGFGALEIFLVPIGPDQTGQRYEAVFN
jgi:hypothetical protein